MNLIVCLGNRFYSGDGAGPLVHDALAGKTEVQGVEVLDGGIAGLNLLPLLRGRKRIVFVDSVAGFAPPGEVVVLDADQLKTLPMEQHYGHDSGLLYLLHALPVTFPEQESVVLLVGLEGDPREPGIAKAARTALCLAAAEPGRTPMTYFLDNTG